MKTLRNSRGWNRFQRTPVQHPSPPALGSHCPSVTALKNRLQHSMSQRRKDLGPQREAPASSRVWKKRVHLQRPGPQSHWHLLLQSPLGTNTTKERRLHCWLTRQAHTCSGEQLTCPSLWAVLLKWNYPPGKSKQKCLLVAGHLLSSEPRWCSLNGSSQGLISHLLRGTHVPGKELAEYNSPRCPCCLLSLYLTGQSFSVDGSGVYWLHRPQSRAEGCGSLKHSPISHTAGEACSGPLQGCLGQEGG